MQKDTVIHVATVLVLAMAFFAVGCSAPQTPAPEQPAATPAEPQAVPEQPAATAAPEEAPATTQYKIGMSQCNLGEPWREQMNADIAKAAEAHPEIVMEFKDAQNDTLRQRNHIEEFVSSGVDLLIVSPLEAAPLTEPIAKAYQAGIPVIVLDRAVMGDQYSVFIGADNKLIGKAAGEWIVRHLNGTGRVVELQGLMTSTPGQDRHTGFVEALEGTGVEVIFAADMKWLEPNARKEMESALARFDDIDVVYAHNDPAAHGAYLAAKEAGRDQDIVFVGIDGLPQEGLAYVREGILNACFEYPTGGREAIDVALKLLKGETVDKNIVLSSRFFTPENIEQGGEWLAALDTLDDAAPETAPADAPQDATPETAPVEETQDAPPAE